MESRAYLKQLRISPRKVRLVADTVRGASVQDARKTLGVLIKRSSEPMLKLLNSAVANAENNFKMVESNLYVSKIFVDEGPVFKRWMPRAMGRATEILKRTSHITIILGELEEGIKRKADTDKSVSEENTGGQGKNKSGKQGISVKAAQTDTAKMKTSGEASKKKFQRRKVI